MSNIKTINDYNEKPVEVGASYQVNNNYNNNSYNNNNYNSNLNVSQTSENNHLFKYERSCITWR